MTTNGPGRHCYEYPRPAVTVDCVIFGLDEAAGGDLKVLLIRRGTEPFKDRWALPGGFVEMDESLDAAAARELEEETGLKVSPGAVGTVGGGGGSRDGVYLEQLYTFGEPGRDPRGRVISVAYWALTRVLTQPVRAASDASAAAWFSVGDEPRLAFDHAAILRAAHERLRAKVRYRPVGFHLLPHKFTLTQMQRVYEAILQRPLDKRNFRKKVLDTGLIIETDEVQTDVAHRAARLYRFDRARYDKLGREGMDFEI